jgi:hypothetical protein
MPPQWYSILLPSMFAEWGLNQSEYSSRGDPSTNLKGRRLRGIPRHDESRPSLGGAGMKEATKRAASEALAQMLAVTAMVVIASIVLYWR